MDSGTRNLLRSKLQEALSLVDGLDLPATEPVKPRITWKRPWRDIARDCCRHIQSEKDEKRREYLDKLRTVLIPGDEDLSDGQDRFLFALATRYHVDVD